MSGAVGTDKAGLEGRERVEFFLCQRMGWDRNGDVGGEGKGSRRTKELWREICRKAQGAAPLQEVPLQNSRRREDPGYLGFQRHREHHPRMFLQEKLPRPFCSRERGDKGQHGEVALPREEQQEGDVGRAPALMKCHQSHSARQKRRRQNQSGAEGSARSKGKNKR